MWAMTKYFCISRSLWDRSNAGIVSYQTESDAGTEVSNRPLSSWHHKGLSEKNKTLKKNSCIGVGLKTYGTLWESTVPSEMESSFNHAFVFCRKKIRKTKSWLCLCHVQSRSQSSVLRDTSCSRCFEQELPEKQRKWDRPCLWGEMQSF